MREELELRLREMNERDYLKHTVGESSLTGLSTSQPGKFPECDSERNY